MTNAEKPLEVKKLKKTYKTKNKVVEAVKEVSFYTEPGEIFGLLGPNGAGKTTVISTISSLETPTEGEVLVFGKSVQAYPRITKLNTGVVPQELINQGFFNLVEILTFHSGYFGISSNREHIDFLLKRLSLWDHRNKMVKELSGGMKRRMMIAKALVHKPRLLLLDEPTAGVDIELRRSLWEFVLELKKSGVSVLLTTHYLEEAEQLCDRIGIINHGKLEYLGPTKEIIKNLTQRMIEIEFSSPQPQLQTCPFYVDSQNQKMRFQIPSTQSVGGFLSEFKVDYSKITDISTKDGSLEDAFRQVLKNKQAEAGKTI